MYANVVLLCWAPVAANWSSSEIPVNKCDDERDGSGVVMCVAVVVGTPLG